MPDAVGRDELDTLFLLELLVDKVKIDRQPNLELGAKLKETCVVFKIMDFPPLIVTEEDFVYLDNYEDTEVNFKSGKSVLFSLPSSGPPYQPGDTVYVNVGRRTDPPPSPDQHTVPIGQAEISLAGSFSNLMKECDFKSLPSTSSKTIKGTYDLLDESSAKTGTVTIFLRLSCFGKLIVTEFEAKSAQASKFWFRGGPDGMEPRKCEDPSDMLSPQPSRVTGRSTRSKASQVPSARGPGGGGPCPGGAEGRFVGPCIGSQQSRPQGAGQFQQSPMYGPPPPGGYPPHMYYSPPMMGPMGMPPQYGPYGPMMGAPQMSGAPPGSSQPWGQGGAYGQQGPAWSQGPGAEGVGGRQACPKGLAGPTASSRCLTDRQTQVEDGDVKVQAGDKKSLGKKSVSEASKSTGAAGSKKKKGKK